MPQRPLRLGNAPRGTAVPHNLPVVAGRATAAGVLQHGRTAGTRASFWYALRHTCTVFHMGCELQRVFPTTAFVQLAVDEEKLTALQAGAILITPEVRTYRQIL